MESALLSLGSALSDDLLEVAAAEVALTLLDGAVKELDKRVDWAQKLALALGPLARAEPLDSTAVDLLQAARREVHKLSASHLAIGRAFAIGRVFAIGRACIGAHDHPELVEVYEGHRQAGFLSAKDCVTKLLSAAGYAEAAGEVLDLARILAYTSPLRRSWADTAEELARAAHLHASSALRALLLMRHEVALESFAAGAIIQALKRDRWLKTARDVPMKIHAVATFFLAEPADASPREKVEAAIADLDRVLELHVHAGDDLTSAAHHLGLPRGDLWSRWTTRHQEVAAAGQKALLNLQTALSMLDDLDNALQAGKAPNEFIRGAAQRLRSARDQLKQTRHCATLEFFDSAWITLKHIHD